ncbi:Mandelate racemase/muconate lactonizing protein (plasmid) [Haloterrigena turkmenica DSM 5511]|uniref:Mandelate racemase/muconate lactonizing protein n=1 Tax=Haloterrigena turkmenica (strain ATCC 51198 / DSM 5511 / JCM 9101 / NCIMB 13204 / VKM B-1734 / 4k) TaxID=543526 RepID=D2S1J9_HALTV|nr:mandelate racemase/muconate lactonizing enzyme family protein [Haloterrigena turkmenica]ADB63246.1 Mandelate racemase/muconate lactonizing protein [Haloterrigena turkmenica DSM 5511]
MEITDVQAIPLAHSLPDGEGLGDARGFGTDRGTTLVRLETDDGTVGWGEAFAPGPMATATIETMFADDVVGMDPFEVESLAENSYTDPYHFGGDVVVQSAVSAIDVACWDIIGKSVGRPAHRLLGGTRCEKLTPYASTMYFTEADRPIEEPIRDAVEEGFTAAKIKIGADPESDAERVRTAREILGDDADLMVDMNGNYRPHQAVKSARAIEEYDVTWIEEPVPPENASGYRELRGKIDIPIAAGEAHYGRFEFKELIDDRTVDIVQPNLGRCGGLSEARLIAGMASTENVAVRPHIWNSAVGMAAAVQFAASISNYPHTRNVPEPMLIEFDRSENPMRSELLETPFDPAGGTIDVPQEPGLGIEIDQDALERYRAD